jgi:hypothetical protein
VALLIVHYNNYYTIIVGWWFKRNNNVLLHFWHNIDFASKQLFWLAFPGAGWHEWPIGGVGLAKN